MAFLRSLLRRPADAPKNAGPLYESVRSAMGDVQAYARSHGGEIELLSVSEEGEVRLSFHGACRGCPMAGLTLKHGVEEQLKILVPGVTRVIQAK